jgi:uracil-DNA glycosylase family 4
MLSKPESCKGCPLREFPFGKSSGFSKPDGTGKSGVMVVGEALGEEEEKVGKAFVGKAGQYLFSQLQRVGVERDDLTIFNVIACRPPQNKLVGMPYQSACITHCAPNLDKAIEDARTVAATGGKSFVIVTLGKTAFKRVMGLDDKHPVMTHDYLAYPFWHEGYKAWVLAADHPSYLMRGNHHLVPILQYVFKRAMEIADNGMAFQEPQYLLDPTPQEFAKWVDECLAQSGVISYDIETPYKQDRDEEEVSKEEDDDYTILRCSFAYQAGRAVSVPWRAEYMADLGRLFAGPQAKLGWNSDNYDHPRVSRQLPINGDQIDGMLAWHVLNSALPKGLGFVAPFYAKNVRMWKHLSDAEPAFYNAKDADMAFQIWQGVENDLKTYNLWSVFDKHVIQLNRIFRYMSRQGVKMDLDARLKAEETVAKLLADADAAIQAAIPPGARAYKPYKKTPKDTTGMVQVKGIRRTTKCPVCFQHDVKADHFKGLSKKKLGTCRICEQTWKKHGGEDHDFTPYTDRSCIGSKAEKVMIPDLLWAQPLPFKLSKLSLERYQNVVGHRAIQVWDRDSAKRKATFDEKAILKLTAKYPNDPLYPLILDFRGLQKLLGTYIGVTNESGVVQGGMPVMRDGRVHTTFSHNPSTLRSASQNPNLQNLPRPQGGDDPATLIRNLFVADPGNVLYARDYSGIEGVLTGYFANAPNYIRLAKQDVHSFYTAYAIHQTEPGRISANDLPLLSWDDDKLFTRLAELKSEFKKERNNLYKHLVHAANFGQGPKGAADTILRMSGKEVSSASIGRVMDIYYDLFPEIRKWHKALLAQVDRDGYLRNPFGYVHRFFRAYEWELIDGTWEKTPGADSNKIYAFLPQSTAAGIIKDAMLKLWDDHYDEAGQYLRLLIHDECFFEVPESKLERLDAIAKEVMELPNPALKLPWDPANCLSIQTEAKQGKSWGTMH